MMQASLNLILMLALKFVSSKPANDTYSSIDWGYLVWGWIAYNPYPIPDSTLPRRSTIYCGDDLNCTTATNKGPRYNWASAVNACHIGRIKDSTISQKTRWFCNSSWNWMRCRFHQDTVWTWVSHNRSSYIETHAECRKPTNFLDRWSHVQYFLSEEAILCVLSFFHRYHICRDLSHSRLWSCSQQVYRLTEGLLMRGKTYDHLWPNSLHL